MKQIHPSDIPLFDEYVRSGVNCRFADLLRDRYATDQLIALCKIKLAGYDASLVLEYWLSHKDDGYPATIDPFVEKLDNWFSEERNELK